MKKPGVLAAIVLIIIIAVSGCARFPSGSTSVSGTQLVITMTVQGQINPNYFYYVAIDNDGDPNTGPVAVAGPPWGNGWGGGFITSFVLFNRTEPVQGYTVYQVLPNTNLIGKVREGVPISAVPVSPGSRTLQFTVDLSQLDTTAIPADQIQSLNINFINVTEPCLDPNFPGPRPYDGLGEFGTDFLTVEVTTPRTYSNETSRNESPGDVIDPDLDIIDWSIEVQRFQ